MNKTIISILVSAGLLGSAGMVGSQISREPCEVSFSIEMNGEVKEVCLTQEEVDALKINLQQDPTWQTAIGSWENNNEK